jgi:hypothetical protein
MEQSGGADAAADWALDGNAIGALLHDVFGTEMTTAVGTCVTCGAAGPLAEKVVYLRAPGIVVRCRNCGAVLIVVVQRGEQNCISLEGLAALVPR